MVRNQRRKQRPRGSRRAAIPRLIGQIANSQPIIKRNRGNNDPPLINHNLKVSRVLRYDIHMRRVNSSGSDTWVVYGPSSTTSRGSIRREVPLSNSVPNANCIFDFSLSQLAQDLRDYAFGTAPSQICEFAVQSINFYGPTYPHCRTITLRMDFSSEKAASLVSDSPGSTSRRAYVGLRMPQLVWFNEQSLGANAMRGTISGVKWDDTVFPPVAGYDWELGCLDISFVGVCGPTVLDAPTAVHVRDDMS